MARELTEAPVGRHERHLLARQHQRQPLGVVAVRLHPDRRALRSPGPASLGAAAHRGEELRQGQVPLVRRPREPLRGHAADPLAAAHIHLVAAALTASGVQNIQLGSWVISMTGAGSLSPSLQPVTDPRPNSNSLASQRECAVTIRERATQLNKVCQSNLGLERVNATRRKWYGKRKMRVLP